MILPTLGALEEQATGRPMPLPGGNPLECYTLRAREWRLERTFTAWSQDASSCSTWRSMLLLVLGKLG